MAMPTLLAHLHRDGSCSRACKIESCIDACRLFSLVHTIHTRDECWGTLYEVDVLVQVSATQRHAILACGDRSYRDRGYRSYQRGYDVAPYDALSGMMLVG